MTFAQIQDRIQALVSLAGWANAPFGVDYAFLANEGLRIFTEKSRHNIEQLTVATLLNQATYSILDPADPREWISLADDALYNFTGPGLPITAWIQQTTLDNLRIQDRTWQAAPPGTPTYWYWWGPQTIGFYSPPAQAGIPVLFEGPRYEPIMLEDDDQPSFNAVYHEGVCLLGAWHYGKLYARGEGRRVVSSYLTEGEAYVRRMKANMNSQRASLVQRRVARPEQEYIGMGSLQIPLWPWNS